VLAKWAYAFCHNEGAEEIVRQALVERTQQVAMSGEGAAQKALSPQSHA